MNAYRRPNGTQLSARIHKEYFTPADIVQDRRVQFNDEMKMRAHIAKTTQMCFLHLRRLRQIRRDVTATLVSALVPLEFRGNYSATSNNMKLVHWPLMGGLLHLGTRGDSAGPQPA